MRSPAERGYPQAERASPRPRVGQLCQGASSDQSGRARAATQTSPGDPPAHSHLQPTHYAPCAIVPGPQFGDPKGQEDPGALAVIAQAGPLAADCGTAPPCGGRRYGGPARGPTFNWWRTRRVRLDNSAEEMQRQADNEFERLLSPEEVAGACGLSRRAVYRAIARGELPAARLCNRLRIRPAEFEKWIGAGTPRPETAARPDGRTTPRAGTARGLRALLAEEGRASL
jgi:excisionase family DNA binding protein